MAFMTLSIISIAFGISRRNLYDLLSLRINYFITNKLIAIRIMKSYELIKKRLKDLNIKKTKFVADALGYKNINKGLRKFDMIIDGSPIELKNVPAISKVLEIREEELLESMIETEIETQREFEESKQKIIIKERESFKPYFYSINELSIPSPIFAGNMTHNMRFVYYYKDFMRLPLEQQLTQVKFDIIEHFTKNKGRISAFREIIRYVYRYDYDLKEQELIILSTKGEIIKDKEGLRVDPGSPGGIYIKRPKNRINQLLKLKSQIIDNRN